MNKIFTFLLIVSSSSVFGQQLVDFSLFRENAFLYNPALAGTQQTSVINLAVRRQWTNINQSPTTFSASFHTGLEKKSIGLGGAIFNDFIGPTSYTGLTAAFAYNLVFSEDRPGISHYKVLSFGLSASVVQYRLNASKIKLDQPQDDAIFNSRGSQVFPDAAFGIYYQSRTIFASMSIPQLLHLNVTVDGQSGGESTFRKMQHYYATFGGRIFFGRNKDASEKNLYIEPAFNFHYVINAPPQAMLTARIAMKDVFFAGLGYRSLSTLMLEGGFTIKKQFSIYYAYDMAAGNIRQDAGQVHEIGLQFKFNKKFGSF